MTMITLSYCIMICIHIIKAKYSKITSTENSLIISQLNKAIHISY